MSEGEEYKKAHDEWIRQRRRAALITLSAASQWVLIAANEQGVQGELYAKSDLQIDLRALQNSIYYLLKTQSELLPFFDAAIQKVKEDAQG